MYKYNNIYLCSWRIQRTPKNPQSGLEKERTSNYCAIALASSNLSLLATNPPILQELWSLKLSSLILSWRNSSLRKYNLGLLPNKGIHACYSSRGTNNSKGARLEVSGSRSNPREKEEKAWSFASNGIFEREEEDELIT